MISLRPIALEIKQHSERLTAHCGMAFAEAWQGLKLVHDAGTAGEDVIGPVDDGKIVEVLDVELPAGAELEEDEAVWELLLVLLGKESVTELDGASDVVVVVVEVTDGRAERQVQTAWALLDAGIALMIPHELMTHPIAKAAMLLDWTGEQGHLISPAGHPTTEAALFMQPDYERVREHHTNRYVKYSLHTLAPRLPETSIVLSLGR